MSARCVLVGRFCPVHAGHEAVIRALIARFGQDSCLVGIGSSNHAVSIRHFFSYEERRRFLLHVFPGLNVFGLPDYPTDEEWMLALDDILRVSGSAPHDMTFFEGCQEEVDFFYRFGRKVEIMNRFDGSTPRISATEVRDALIRERPLEGLLNGALTHTVRACFQKKWEAFKKM